MLVTKEIEVKPNKKTIQHYIDSGYNAKCLEPIIVKVEDLLPNSRFKIEIECDYCKRHFLSPYSSYVESIKYINKNACNNPECKNKKRKEINMLRYGVENTSQLKEFQEKWKLTNVERYGVPYYIQTKQFEEKKEKALLELYGVKVPCKNHEILEKVHQTNIKRYGVKTPMESEEIKERYKNSIKDKYGVEWVVQASECRTKQEKTCLEKYGATNPLSSLEIREKVKNTNIEKYGVDNLLKNADIKKKQMYSLYNNGTAPCSIQQKYLHLLFGGELNYIIGKRFFADICFPKEKLVIEYDGGGRNLAVVTGKITKEEFDQKEIIRNAIIKREGYKQMRIISSTDKLPLDSTLFQMLSYTKEYFSKYPEHSWIEYNIDSSSIRSAEHKYGIFFNYGDLRTIKDSNLKTV